jgi:hypothetical protein
MKTKKFDKKLVLNKKTIAHLNKGEMNAVEGGYVNCITGGLDTCVPLTATCTSICETTSCNICC